jgi:hypothetical protein
MYTLPRGLGFYDAHDTEWCRRCHLAGVESIPRLGSVDERLAAPFHLSDLA